MAACDPMPPASDRGRVVVIGHSIAVDSQKQAVVVRGTEATPAIIRMLSLAKQTLKLVDDVPAHAQELTGLGVKPMDSLHRAFASWARAFFFCTCDDKLVKKAKELKSLNTTVVTLLQLVAEVAQRKLQFDRLRKSANRRARFSIEKWESWTLFVS